MSRGKLRAALLLAAMAAVAGSPGPARAAPGVTALVSATTGGTHANGPTPATSVPDTTSPALSQDGLSVAYSSDATNLVSGDTNHVSDVFVRNLITNKEMRVSTTSSGRQANGASYSPALNVYGDMIAFVSEATNLVSGDTNGVADVFVKNLKTGSIVRASVTTSGAQANGASNSPFLSLFGEYLTFESAASNIDRADDNGLPDAFLRKLKTGSTTRINAPTLRQEVPAVAATQWTDSAQVSYDGRTVSFVRLATRNVPHKPPVAAPSAPAPVDLPSAPDAPLEVPSAPLAPALDPQAIRDLDVPSALDVYVLDRSANTIMRIAVPTFGFPATGQPLKIMNDHPVLSADGRIVAFESWSILDHDDAVVRNPFDFKKIMLYDRAVKSFMRASVPTFGAGVVEANGDSWHPTINAGGAIVAFLSDASNLVTGDENDATDVFVRDAPARTTSRSSLDSSGRQADASSARPSMSYEGRRVAFASSATNLVAGDSDAHSDAFVRDRQTNTLNAIPRLSSISGIRQATPGEPLSISLKAKDADDDPLRYGVLLSVPPGPYADPAKTSRPTGSSIDPSTGVFTWTPVPTQTGPWYIVFWVSDPRGDGTYQVAEIKVRSPQDVATCKSNQTC